MSEVPKGQLYIIRGLPGAGKSRLAQQLADLADCTVLEADDFFMDYSSTPPVYKFCPDGLVSAHKWCHERVEMGMQNKEATIIVANTFTRRWEMAPYCELARNYSYDVTELTVSAPELTAEMLAARNLHSVPTEAIKRMAARWEQ